MGRKEWRNCLDNRRKRICRFEIIWICRGPEEWNWYILAFLFLFFVFLFFFSLFLLYTATVLSLVLVWWYSHLSFEVHFSKKPNLESS